jgi:uncharacterized iron-regulated membrane protein
MKVYLLLALLFMVGCTNDITPVWTGKGNVPREHPTPEGFHISPYEANQAVWEARRLSLKHIWHIYADGSNYYVVDSFLKSNSRIAESGVIVDGQTGKIKN